MNEEVEAPEWGNTPTKEDKKKPDFADQHDPVDEDQDDEGDPAAVNEHATDDAGNTIEFATDEELEAEKQEYGVIGA